MRSTSDSKMVVVTPSADADTMTAGDVTLLLSPEAMRPGTRAHWHAWRAAEYSNLAIETALRLRLLVHLPANRRISHVSVRDHGPFPGLQFACAHGE
jgi:hypothetical protein